MSTFRRPIDATESLRSTRRSLGDGTVQGRSRLAMPPQGKARGAGLQRLPAVASIQSNSLGETITVDADNVGVSTDPTVVTFTDDVGERSGFVFSAPSDAIQPTFTLAYYDIQVSIDRGSYGGTLAVEILRGDEVVWGPTFDSYWSDPTVPVTAKGRLVDEAVSPWRVRLTGSEAGTVTRVVVQAELVDGVGQQLPLVPEPFEPGTWWDQNVTLTDEDGTPRTHTVPLTLAEGQIEDYAAGDVILLLIMARGGSYSGGGGAYIDVPGGTLLGDEFAYAAGYNFSNTRGVAGVYWVPVTSGMVSTGSLTFETGLETIPGSVASRTGRLAAIRIPGASTAVPTGVSKDLTGLSQGGLTLSGARLAISLSIATHTGLSDTATLDPDVGDLLLQQERSSKGTATVWDVEGSGESDYLLLEGTGWWSFHLIKW